MGTRAAAFTAKIRNLHDYQLRLLHGIMPVPSGVDIANTIKNFSQILLSVLRDVPRSPLEMVKICDNDVARLALFPNLDYKGLYNAIVQLMDVAHLIQYGLHTFGQAILQCLGCLLSFLDADTIDALPYLVASSMAVLPTSLHQEIVNCLCFYILPFTITRTLEVEEDLQKQFEENYASQSVSAILMMVFQFSSNSAHHCQLLECLMAMKPSVVKDLLCIMAYGTLGARNSAAKLLFYYWPPFNVNAIEKRTPTHQVRLAADWPPLVCQRDMCPNPGIAEAAKVCFDHGASIMFANERPPPLYLCIECANEIHRSQPNLSFHDILHPMQQVSLFCENKSCRSSEKQAVSVCFSMECASYNTNHPIRYCKPCHQLRHNNRRGVDHIFHMALTSAWKMDVQMQTFLIEAIVSLLQDSKLGGTLGEASVREGVQLLNVQSTLVDMHASKNTGNQTIPSVHASHSQDILEDRLLLGRYGVWLLVSLCWPGADTHPSMIGRLVSMLCNWYNSTAYNLDQIESAGEKLKTEHVAPWLSSVCANHFDVFVSCLLPHPPDCARVGGHWDTLTSRSAHLRAGLNRLLCLVPYEVVTPDIWGQVMPHWMEALVSDLQRGTTLITSEISLQISVLLSKLLDPEMSPLGFDSQTMYHFLTVRFSKTSASVQKQTLTWIQLLTSLEIVVHLNILLNMFGEGVRTMKVNKPEDTKYLRKPSNLDKLSTLQEGGLRKTSISPVVEDDSGHTSPLSEDDTHPSHLNSNATEFQTDPELNLSCCIMMLDILLKQMQLQNMEKHAGIWSCLASDVCKLLRNMIVSPWVTSHHCEEKRSEECILCESRVIWHQMALKLVTFIAPVQLQQQPDNELEMLSSEDVEKGKKSSPDCEKKYELRPSDVVITMPFPEAHTVGNVLVNMPQIMTATVETVSEQLDLAPIIPAEKVVPAVARAVTLTETDVATAIVQVQKATLVGENDQPIEMEKIPDNREFWETSVGKFWFSFGELPQQLQYCHQILKELPSTTEPDVLYHMLQTLHLLSLHGDALARAAKDHRGFLIWCQENLLINNLWQLLNAEHGHLCEVCVPILLHCITLPSGLDVFWNVLQASFHHQDWRQRFTAVERVTVIARFLDSTPLRNQQQLQSALANAFCYLISSMDDIDVQVAQRATLYLGTVHDRAIKALILCLETQFDSVIVDRPMVLQSLYQLHNSLSDRHIFTWDFFLNRFDTLFIEAQINVEKCGDLTYLRDLRNSDLNSEAFARKLNRAHEALSQSDTSNSGTGSITGGNVTSITSPGSGVPTFTNIKTLSASFGTKWPYKRTMSAPASIVTRADKQGSVCAADKERVYSRQYSAPVLKRRSSGRFGLEGHMHGATVMEEMQACGVLYRIVEFEEADSETVHLLVFLLMQFMSRADQAYPSDEKNVAKAQNIVLRHLYLLLGYNLSERGFHVSPQRLRTCAVFHVFLANLPQVLDHNHLLGLLTLPTVLMILIYCPSNQNINSFVSSHDVLSTACMYSLWLLEPQARKNWLFSVLVILYKYQYTQPPFHSQIQVLIRIVLNTLDAQQHVCRRIPSTLVMSSLPCRSRDVSQPSLGAVGPDASIDLTCDSPPNCHSQQQLQHQQPVPPLYSTLESASLARPAKYLHNNMETHWEEDIIVHCSVEDATASVSYKHAPQSSFSIEADETESELAAIPESPQSGSTLHHSLHGSFEEVSCCPMVEEAQVAMVEPIIVTAVITKAHVIVSDKPTWFLGEESKAYTQQQAEQQDTKWHTAQKLQQLHKAVSQQHSLKREEYFGSPDSPLSKMEVQTIMSPVQIEEFGTVSNLEIPIQERLLPIGSLGVQKESIPVLVDRIKLALGIPENGATVVTERPHDLESLSNAASNEPVMRDNMSPRRLKKQSALLESPPSLFPMTDSGEPHPSAFYRTVHYERKPGSRSEDRQRYRQRKGGLFTIGQQPVIEQNFKPVGAWYPSQAGEASSQQPSAGDPRESTCKNVREDCVVERCSECGLIMEEYSDEEIGLCIIILGTFIHGEPMVAAPMLPEILRIVAKITQNMTYCWQAESKTHLPAGSISVAHQFLRCVLHQLAPNSVFTQMFQTQVPESMRTQFFRSVAQALLDFNELNPIAPLQLLLENLNAKKSLPLDALPNMANNMACYLECLQPLESGFGPQTWNILLTQFESIFRRIALALPAIENIDSLLCIMSSTLKIPGISGFKGILEPFSKVLSYGIQNFTLKYQQLVELCYLCSRAFVRERERLLLTRMVVLELVQALKFKSNIPDSNFFILVNFVLQDSGGCLVMTSGLEQLLSSDDLSAVPGQNTSACECMRQHITDIIEFLTDVHTLSRIKSNYKGINIGLNDDTLGGTLKGGLAQYLSLEITRGNNRDNRAVTRYLPWLCNVPSTIQQGPREFLECMGHIRLLSWMLLGSLNHTALVGGHHSANAPPAGTNANTQTGNIVCQPIPQEVSCHIADHIQVILAGFVEQSKASVLHMSSLFHAFILCQLWTMYLEQGPSSHSPNSEAHTVTMTILFDFWGKVTPCILQLVSHSKVLAEMVNLHFLSLLEALLECNSMVLSKLLPLWCPVIYTHQQQLPGHLQVRLQSCRNFPPSRPPTQANTHTTQNGTNTNAINSSNNQDQQSKKASSNNNQNKLHKAAANPFLLKWLQRLQFKMGQIELQSSAATQFYSV